MSDHTTPRVMLTIEEVMRIVPLKRNRLYTLERTGRFPRAHQLSDDGRRKVWFADEIRAWQDTLPHGQVTIDAPDAGLDAPEIAPAGNRQGSGS